MQTFRDSESREWVIDFSIGNVLRVKDAGDGKFDLLDDPANLGHKLWVDLGAFYECLWRLIEPQAIKAGVSAEEFGRSIAAGCIVEARQKFYEAWKDFFRQLQRETMATALEKILSLNQKAAEMATAKAKEVLTAEFDRKAQAKLDEALSIAFGSLLASVESTPAPTPGDNST